MRESEEIVMSTERSIESQWSFLDWMTSTAQELAAVAKKILVREKVPVMEFLRWLNSQYGRDTFGIIMDSLVLQYLLIIKEGSKLLEFGGTVSLPEMSENFVVEDKFRIKEDGGIISSLSVTFIEWFLLGRGKIEKPTCPQTLRYENIRRAYNDMDVITELGGEDRAETALSEIFFLIEKQKDGEDGVLLNKDEGGANVFYIREYGILFTIRVFWSYGWCVRAYTKYQGPWRSGDRVFYRDPSPKV